MGPAGSRAVAIVGLGAILPDAMSPQAFWENLLNKRYSITETPPDRWSIEHYYDPDPLAPDKTYSKIGGWVKGFEFDWKRFRIPPKVAAKMDQAQQWAVTIADQALTDYGYPTRPLNTERTGVILGTAMGGELHYLTHLRIAFPEYAQALKSVSEFSSLPADIQARILAGWQERIGSRFPDITEDTMPGELPNVVSGRVANVLNLRGGNFITDAACAASFAAVSAAIELLCKGEVDAVITGGVDRNMGASSFVKFCKIGALSATGTRPFGEGADGFVMGEGAAAFLLKRLEDAERDGDRIYAVLRGAGGASDGKGKGITAPNPYGQQLAVRRAWDCAGLDPATAGMIEAHGTSTRVGDLAEAEGLTAVFGKAPSNRIALGSVKSNIGHLKAGAGAAGLLKAVLSIHHGVIPPTLNADPPNPQIPFETTPFYLNHEAREWPAFSGGPRRCGASAFGFGGTNFHLVLEEHVPGRLTSRPRQFASAAVQAGGSVFQGPAPEAGPAAQAPLAVEMDQDPGNPTPLRGIFALDGASPAELQAKLAASIEQVQAGSNLDPVLPSPEIISSPARLVIDYENRPDLLEKLHKAAKALATDNPQVWKALQPQGIFCGQGLCPGKLAFLFPGQGSQYLNMGSELKKASPVVAQVFAEADRVMEPILGKPLSAYILVEADDPEAIRQAEHELKQTAITQPAMLTLDIAIYHLLESFGYRPEMVMGHSLGEYAALVVAGVLPFAQALEAAAARGSEMSKVRVADAGWMAAIMAPLDTVEQTLRSIDGYVVIANLNSYNQCVIGGESQAVEQAIQAFQDRGFNAVRLPVSHAFHTRIVAPASVPLRQVLDRFDIRPPRLPVVANLTGEWYPQTVDEIKDVLQQQIASPVQWVKGLETLYAAGARLFVEAGPKKALKGMVDDVLGSHPEVLSIFTNHPKTGELASFNHALCGLLAAGHLPAHANAGPPVEIRPIQEAGSAQAPASVPETVKDVAMSPEKNGSSSATLESLVQLLAQAVQQPHPGQAPPLYNRYDPPAGSVVVTGLGLGLPGAEKQIMDPDNAMRILRGEQFVDLIPDRFRKRMVAKRVIRVVKSEAGDGSFQTIEDPDEVIRLAGRPGQFDLEQEYGVPAKIVESLDITTQLAMAAGFDAMREAGIPMVQTYRTATTGKLLPDRWLLPESLRDETGVIFASAFPGGDRFADEFRRYYTWQNRIDLIQALEDLRRCASDPQTLAEIHRRLGELREQLEQEPYVFDRRFLFRVLSMGHSQFAEYIGARGPNTQVNAACASTTQAIALAEDWIRGGRCRRVIVIAADAVTGDNLMEWVGAGFLAVGAAATDDRVDEAAIPFDRRRHGTLMGMGACALVIESEDAVRERGMRGIVELLSSETYNSAFHGTRLDVDHIAQVMEKLLAGAERRFGLDRYAIAPYTVFMSHETYTPARGGSASAEVVALRRAFGEAASQIIISNTKGFTGHPMGVGIEDVIAAKILEYGIVPPVPNFKEVDPDLGPLNLSRGGRYPVQYAIHLAAGFGSQIAMTFTRRIPGGPDRVDDKTRYRHWLSQVSGWDRPETEVVRRILRLKAGTPPNRPPAPSAWQPGTGPQVRAVSLGAIPLRNGSHPPLPVETASRAEGEIPAAIPPQAAPPAPAPQAAPQPAEQQLAARHLAAQPISVQQVAEQQLAAQQPAARETEPVAVETRPVEPPASIAARVLAIVAEKTGYPTDMLEPDLDLEADLGVDTVKQAETFAAIREEFSIPRQEDLRLRDYPTLAHVIRFVEKMASPAPEPAPSPAEQPPADPAAQPDETEPVPSEIQARVLAIVAEKTGYPTDMLELDLDLEADLGVDTVKQAETFAAIREEFSIPRQEELRLRDYPTLAHVIQFVERMAAPAAQPEPQATAPPVEARPAQAAQESGPGQGIRFSVPAPALRPPIELCKPAGASLGPGARLIVAAEGAGVAADLTARLEALDAQVLALDVQAGAAEIEARVEAWLEEGPVAGVYWLPGLEPEPVWEELDLKAWRELNRRQVKTLFLLMRLLARHAPSTPAFLISATRLGGLHGYPPQPAPGALGGAVTGFTKAYKREFPLATVKAVDFAPGESPALIAAALVQETLWDPGVVEVGYWEGGRYTIALQEQPPFETGAEIPLDGEAVIVVTGAAGSITSLIVADLARRCPGVYHLLDLAPCPEPESPEIALFRRGREALKQHLVEQARAAGERPTPAAIDRRILEIERQSAALEAIEAVARAGGQARYHSLDLLDAGAVAAVIDEIRGTGGKIDLLVHAAGIEISRPLADKDPAQFAKVYDVKTESLFNLLKAAAGLPLGTVLSFSSVAGRFGNLGQTDYSAANDLLCKLAGALPAWRPGTRGITIDWTAWGEIGMATRGSIPKLMEKAGIDLLPPAVGVPLPGDLLAAGFSGELVVAGGLGLFSEEWDDTGGLDPDKATAWLEGCPPRRLMVERITASRSGAIQLEATLDPQEQPFLFDHQIEGIPVLPGVMGVEAFAQVSSLFAPGYEVEAVEEVRFEQPFKFYRMQPHTLRYTLRLSPAGPGALRAHLELRSITPPARPELPHLVRTHFTGQALLVREREPAPRLDHVLPEGDWCLFTAEEIYQTYFHGPAYRVLDCARVQGDLALGRFAPDLPPAVHPADARLWMRPRLIELCLQTAGLWAIHHQRGLALPRGIGSVRVFPQAEEAAGKELYAWIRTGDEGATFDGHVFDSEGAVYLTLSGYRTVPIPG